MPVSRETEALCNTVLDAMLVSREKAAEILPGLAGTIGVFIGSLATSHDHCLDLVDAVNKSIRQFSTETFVKGEAARAKRAAK